VRDRDTEGDRNRGKGTQGHDKRDRQKDQHLRHGIEALSVALERLFDGLHLGGQRRRDAGHTQAREPGGTSVSAVWMLCGMSMTFFGAMRCSTKKRDVRNLVAGHLTGVGEHAGGGRGGPSGGDAM
jgi:hypothetical protein